MYTDSLNLILGFLEGFALIISPCILPILPLILAGSLTGSKKRPLGIITGFIVVFTLFTFFSRKLVEYSGIDLDIVRNLSYILLLMLGFLMISTRCSEKFTRLTQRLAVVGSKSAVLSKPREDFWSGFLFGALVSLIWAPCAGPILAAVIVQTVFQKTTFMSFLVLLSFAAGAAGPMLIIALLGRSIMPRFRFFKMHAILFRQLLGIVIIATVGYMIFFGNLSPVILTQNATPSDAIGLQDGVARPYPAPEISGISAWINSKPLKLSDLKGKVVLIDFWTYSCINCIHTLPHLKEWYAKYHDKGLIIIGIHSPEFEFEKDLTRVKTAVTKYGLRYPIALDNSFSTWQNFDNTYWPSHYLIDKEGSVQYTHAGEGAYDTTENNIRFLLGLKKTVAPRPTNEGFLSDTITPETYLGYARAKKFVSPEILLKNQVGQYSFPHELALHSWALRGGWTIYSDRIVSAEKAAALELQFKARKVYMVMGTQSEKPLTVKILLDGKPLNTQKGKDVAHSSLQVSKHRLYEVLSLSQSSAGNLQILPQGPGLEIYTFTFED